MNVLLALQQLSGDGASRFALDIGAQLQRLGAKVKLFVYRAPDGSEVAHGGPEIPVIYGQPVGMRQRYWAPILTGRLLTAVMAADVVLGAQEGGEGVAAAYLAARLTMTSVATVAQANVIASLANSGGWTVPVIERAYPRFDRLVCVSDGVRDTALEMGARPEQITVIPNGVDVDRVRQLAAEPPPYWLPEEPYLVALGRLEPQKGFDVLVRAFGQAREAGLDQRLVIVGEGGERPALERMVAELGLGDHVLLPGYARNPFPVVARSAAFCLSSRYEGSPLVLAEALTLGRPVIATDCVSGPREILADGEFGRLVPTEDVGELAAAMVANEREPQVLLDKAAGAAAQVERFSVATSAQAYMRELTALAGTRRARAPRPVTASTD